MNKIPIEIINKILVYVGEINNELVITQYNPYNRLEYYNINFFSDKLWNMKATIRMHYLYRLTCSSASECKNRELYKWGKNHYEKELRDGKSSHYEYSTTQLRSRKTQ